MPNWCNNTITITGGANTIRNLWEEAQTAIKDEDGKGSFGLLSAMAPEPDYSVTEVAPAVGEEKIMSDWWDWRVTNWGTKWDVGDDGLEFEDHGDGTATIRGWFDSAWSPPLEAFNTFCEDMDGVYAEIYYHEPGMTFVGYWDSEGSDDHYDYGAATSGTIRDVIPEYLDDHFDISGDMEMWEEEEKENV